ncbi:MAG: His/Gly/Thr/Pro-type tRNA ligase C-terminal domain-containing protein, partial [Thermodesulfobacteriota bacterium]
DRQIPYGEKIYQQLIQNGIRVEKDFRNEKLGYKIREAQIQKIPFMLVVGDREEKEGTVSPRKRSGETIRSMGVKEFVEMVKSETPTL